VAKGGGIVCDTPYLIHAFDLQADSTALESILAEDALAQGHTSKVEPRVLSCCQSSVATGTVGNSSCFIVL
jgi:hypothetical protein